jgi:ankyrin repeat protein
MFALAKALKYGYYDLAKTMTEAGVDCNENVWSFSRLFEKEDLSFEQKAEIAAFNIDIDQPLYNSSKVRVSLLHRAANRCDVDLVRFLINKGVDINSLDGKGQTALFYAITAFGGDIDWSNSVIEDKKTARIKFTSDVPYYSDPGSLQRRQVTVSADLVNAGINVNQQNYAGWTVLHYAAANCSKGMQNFLVESGADASLKTSFGRTVNDILALREKASRRR